MADSQSKPSGMSSEGDNENDGDQSPGSVNVDEHKFLPMLNIIRIMKRSLPSDGKISQDAKETMQECVSEFISFITDDANEKCKTEIRNTIKGDDLLCSMTTLGLEQYTEPLKVYLQRYMESERGVQPNQMPQVSQPAQQRPGSQVPNENSQVSQPAHQSSGSQVPNENSQVSQSKPLGMCPERDDESEGDQSPGSVNVCESDKFLPMLNIIRIMRRSLPPYAKITKDAKEIMQECVYEFISIITNKAVEKRKGETRKTINGDDLLCSMTTLGLEPYAEPLKVYLQKYREVRSTLSQPKRGVQQNQVPQVSQPPHQSSFSQGPSENPQNPDMIVLFQDLDMIVPLPDLDM